MKKLTLMQNPSFCNSGKKYFEIFFRVIVSLKFRSQERFFLGKAATSQALFVRGGPTSVVAIDEKAL